MVSSINGTKRKSMRYKKLDSHPQQIVSDQNTLQKRNAAKYLLGVEVLVAKAYDI